MGAAARCAGRGRGHARLDDLARRVRAAEPAALQAIGMPGTTRTYTAQWPNFVLFGYSPAYPTAQSDPLLYGVLNTSGARLSLFSRDQTGAGWAAILRATSPLGPVYHAGDLRYTLSGSRPPTLTYDFGTRTISFSYEISRNSLKTSKGNILSVPDLERSTVFLDTMAGMTPKSGLRERVRQLRMHLRPREMTIRTANRTFQVKGERFQARTVTNGYRIYAAGPLGPPTDSPFPMLPTLGAAELRPGTSRGAGPYSVLKPRRPGPRRA